MDGDLGNIVHLQFRYTLFLLQGVDIAAIVDAANQTLGFEGGLTDYVFVSYGSRALVKPAYIQRDILFDARLLLICLYEGVATRNVDVIVQRQSNAHRGISLLQVLLHEVDALHGALRARWQYSYLIARTDDAAAHSARITAVVRELAADRTNHILYREAEEIAHHLMTYRNRLQIVQQSRSLIPRSLIALVHHVVAILGADRDKYHVLDIQRLRHLLVVGNNLVVYIFTEINQVHLVDSHQDMWYTEQRRNIAVAHGLLQYTMTCINQNDAQVGSTSTRYHVAGILNMSRSIGDDKLAFRCGEIAVSHIDGDALFALSTETIREQSQVHFLITAALASSLHRLQLVFENRLAVIKQSSYQSTLSIVHAARSREAEQLHI